MNNQKMAMKVHLPEYRECSCCHGSAIDGYILRDNHAARFICTECYAAVENDYPTAKKVIEIPGSILNEIQQEEVRSFHAGYLMGSKENLDNGAGYRLVVSRSIESTCPSKGTTCFFTPQDVSKIRTAITEHCKLIGLYRTSPSGTAEFNQLDNKLVDDLLMDIVYVLIGGKSEIQIAARDRNSDTGEIGVVIS